MYATSACPLRQRLEVAALRRRLETLKRQAAELETPSWVRLR